MIALLQRRRSCPNPSTHGQWETPGFQLKEMVMAKYPDVTAGQTEACINRMGGWHNFLRFIGGQGKIVFDPNPLLTLLRTVEIPAQPKLTTSGDYFEEAGMKWMGDNFQAQFFGLEVSATEPSNIKVSKLEKDSLDVEILANLGDEAEISIQEFKTFLATNRESSGVFIFYLRGNDGNLWAVRAGWSVISQSWSVGASPATDTGRWDADHRLVSRN